MITEKEKELLSFVCCDLLTGNHLLGRPRSEEQKNIHNEFCYACKAINDEQSLTLRQKELIKEMSKNFQGGIDDMLEQLMIDKNKFNKVFICGES